MTQRDCRTSRGSDGPTSRGAGVCTGTVIQSVPTWSAPPATRAIAAGISPAHGAVDRINVHEKSSRIPASRSAAIPRAARSKPPGSRVTSSSRTSGPDRFTRAIVSPAAASARAEASSISVAFVSSTIVRAPLPLACATSTGRSRRSVGSPPVSTISSAPVRSASSMRARTAAGITKGRASWALRLVQYVQFWPHVMLVKTRSLRIGPPSVPQRPAPGRASRRRLGPIPLSALTQIPARSAAYRCKFSPRPPVRRRPFLPPGDPMRTPLLASALLLFLSGCAAETSYVHTDTTLGRVVVYRNGIAYFERTAAVPGETLNLSVPADKVDDFLKSLTVVDAKTGEPAPISYPTRQSNPETGLIDMKITLPPTATNGVILTYVTESPSWKPSYRIVLKDKGKVSVQAWAIVDNTSGEDWKNVKLGVGSSSALSFRFDLRNVRLVQRETLQTNDQFAMAPPTGGATYGAGQGPTSTPRLVMEIGDEALAKQEKEYSYDIPTAGAKDATRAFQTTTGTAQGAYGGGKKGNAAPAKPMPVTKAPPPPPAPNPLESMARNLKTSPNQIVVEGYADARDTDKIQASLERANRAREQLVRAGLDPNKVVAVGNGMQSGKSAGVRIVEAPQTQTLLPAGGAKASTAPAEPIGSSHFESTTSMTVARGTSAMVSILKTDTDGEVVYFYDAESARGNKNFPFNAVRIRNPTDSVLETGPVTVFGDGKFVGEGLTEPIPAKSIAFIPFALDRQVLVETEEDAVDKIAKIITVQRGVFSTEVQHTRRSKLTLNNRTAETAVVYIRHTVPEGYTLTKPENAKEKLGAAYLLKIEIEPRSKKEITIEEATPLFKSTDIRGSVGMDMVVAYLSQAATEGPLKEKVDGLLKIQREIGNIEQKITTMREQMEEYRARMDELHVQLVSLKAVKTAGPLMQSLEKKLSEVSDKLSKATIDLVGEQEKLMVAKIKFQDGVAELSMEKKKDEPKPEAAPVPKKV